MPKKVEKALKKSSRKAGLKGKKAKAYIFGTLNKIEKERKEKRK